MIKVRGLSKTYPSNKTTVSILSEINIDVARGEIFGIIGKSGAGKSTLIKCLNLLERPDSGSICINGANLLELSAAQLRQMRRKIGVIFQGFNLLGAKTVFENVALPLRLQGEYSKSEIKDKVTNLLSLVGLSELASAYPSRLSGGQKQRVGIARALATDPLVLLSDEATSALDQETTNSILQLLLEINERLGLTIILITHEIEVVRKICDRVAVLDTGRIIEYGSTVEVILHPKQELTRKLILEEETHKYLEQVTDYYRFEKSEFAHLLLLSFIGEVTFAPIISSVTGESGVAISILRGELGRIKKMPFGQLLVDIRGDAVQLAKAIAVITKLKIHYEIIH